MTEREDILSLGDDDLAKLAEANGASVAWATDPKFRHVIEATPEQIRAMLAAASTPPAAEAPGQEPSAGEIERVAAAMAGREYGRPGEYLRSQARAAIIETRRLAPPTYAVAEAKEFERGIEAAANFVLKRLEDYVSEHGIYDPSTGVTEFSDGGEYEGELVEIEEGIRSLASPAPKGET